ncbi:DUF819 family protein [Portibacter lacus]|uniref:Membrane protein n=1 Tax=Portibacter lacus TaxID=1099794 RepID=A0AA37WDZ5_9BACT|nr:DUF819 family protein [Portibacter lacus]GLR16572.1 membrane protein [Portibacter lacus]
MEPVFTNDAVVLGILLVILALIFHTSSLAGWKRFYTFLPTVLMCYFVPALLNWPLGLIAPHWYTDSILEVASQYNLVIPKGMSFDQITTFLSEAGVPKAEYTSHQGHSSLYFVTSRYLLPASLVLLCVGIDFKGIVKLGPKALIMFFAATLGIIIGGPIALLFVSYIAPGVIESTPGEVWRGLSTIAGSWIGGGANQAAMKEIYEVSDNLFGSMIVVDVLVANIWMGVLLFGINFSDKIDRWLKADNSAIHELKERVSKYRASIEKVPTTNDVFILLAVAFGAVAISHWGKDVITPFMEGFKERLEAMRLNSLMSSFFWLIVIATTVGVLLSFTKARKLEGVGASRWGTIFIYLLVATIGMKMNVGEIFDNLGLFLIGIIWMMVHVLILFIVGKLIKAPYFFIAVGSQANVGGAASAPIVASAFDPALAPVGVLMAVLGYAMGTYGAIICAMLMQAVSG